MNSLPTRWRNGWASPPRASKVISCQQGDSPFRRKPERAVVVLSVTGGSDDKLVIVAKALRVGLWRFQKKTRRRLIKEGTSESFAVTAGFKPATVEC